MELKQQNQKVYVVIDKVKNMPVWLSLNFTDNEFIRDNWALITHSYQFKDIEAFCLGDSCDLIQAIISHEALPNEQVYKVSFGSYVFDTETENLLKGGMKQEEIEAYFAERSKKNRGITEKEIISIMENFLAQKSAKKIVEENKE